MRPRTTLTALLHGAASCGVASRAEPPVARAVAEAPGPFEVSATAQPPEPSAAPEQAWSLVAERRLSRGRLILGRESSGRGVLLIAADGETPNKIRCDDRLEGAWGMWVDDVDGDGNAEAIVALHKRARFDDRLANRLHVYSFERDQCVPAWRGTRLAGRFDAVATDAEDHGALLVHEWLSPTRHRVARYRWQGFGYRVESVAWEGAADPPPDLVAALDFGPSPL